MTRSTSSSSSPKPPRRGEKIVGDVALAIACGVSTKTVYNWKLAGLPRTQRDDGVCEYDLDTVNAWRPSTPDVDNSDTAKLSVLGKRADVELKVAKATEIRRRQKLAEGEILDRETYELYCVEACQKARDRFLQLPLILAKFLPAEGRDLIIAELKREIERTLHELHKDLERGPDKET